MTVTDDDGASASSTTTIAVNGAPTVGVGGPYSGVEGAGVTLNGTAADPDADGLTVSWTRTDRHRRARDDLLADRHVDLDPDAHL